MAEGYPPPPALWNYTARQLDLFYKQAQRQARSRQADMIEAAAIAFNGKAVEATKKLRRT